MKQEPSPNVESNSTADSPVIEPAVIYDKQFVPALFQQWGPVLCEVAGVKAGQRVLDVGCGTGALTLEVATRVSPGGSVVGLDANPNMLMVARGKSDVIEWCEGRAEELPFDDVSFDTVLSQFAMMFFDDPVTALGEMQRVLRPGGRMVVAVCDTVEHSPGYAALATLLDRLFGRQIGDAFRAPFVLGDSDRLKSLCAAANLGKARVTQLAGTVRFASIDALVSTERACVWTLGGLLDDAQFEQLLEGANDVLRPFIDSDGMVAFSMPALVISAERHR